MTIRPALLADRDEWLRMLHGLYPDTMADDHAPDVDGFLAGEVAGHPTMAAVFVSEREGGGLNGFLEMSVRDYAEGCDGRTPHVESWFVDADSRGRGVGRALLAAAEAWAREHGYREIASDTQLDNANSERLQGLRLRRGGADDPLPQSALTVSCIDHRCRHLQRTA